MLDHFNIPPGAGFPDHPHRGQETITYLLEGAVDHEDFTGSAGTIYAGDLQFMTAGKGIVHAEMPNQNQRANIGMQLWVDLPEEDKMSEPQYRDLKGSQIPHVDVDGGKVKVIIIKSHSHGTDSLPDFRPTKTEISMLDIEIKPGGKITQKVDDNWNAFAYVLGGDIRFGEGEDKTVIGQYNFVKFKQEGDVVVAEVDENATESGRFILVAGKPLDQTVVQYGPFVLTTQEDALQAVSDYRASKNGFERAWGWSSKIGRTRIL
ncbi:hypothetical protein HYALB_00000561 [Hymenoscyphus albidus]|uniref:Pirin n=1 Tax=Hymenoscyphus albidus TaxID=595503 RepID=A0A9N9M3D8_9HELO|nr:hypothetical protein HYALB_00000561 [Hymenoscyphus albidus]